MSPLRSSQPDPARPTLRERAAALAAGLARTKREPDPIHAAIAAGRRAEAEMEAYEASLPRGGISADQRRQEDALSAAQNAARIAALAVVPTTRAGQLALAAFARLHAGLCYGEDWREGAVDDGFGELMLALLATVEAGAAEVRPDLSALTLNDLAHLHRTASAVWGVISMYLNAPFAWDERRENYGPLGVIIEAEVDRWEALADDAAKEAARRKPQDDGERDRRVEIAASHDMMGGGPIDDPGVISDLVARVGPLTAPPTPSRSRAYRPGRTPPGDLTPPRTPRSS